MLGSQFELGAAPLHEFPSGSQRSNVFPWDHAGVSSSISGVVPFNAAGGSDRDRQSFARADSRLRGSSLGRDSVGGGVPESPASFGLTSSHRDNAFEFDGKFYSHTVVFPEVTVVQCPPKTLLWIPSFPMPA